MSNKVSNSIQHRHSFNVSTLDQMTEFRKKFVELARAVESLGSSRELSIALTAIEHAQMYTTKHLCLAAEISKTDEIY